MLIVSTLQKQVVSYYVCWALSRFSQPAVAVGLLLLAVLSAPDQVQSQSVKVIRDDSGGSVESRLQEIAQLRSAGTQVEIRGQCASACTMYLGLPRACVAQSSRLGFHGPQSQYYGVSLSPEEFDYWSSVMASHYPAAIRTWFMGKARLTTMGLSILSGSQAIKMGAGACI